MTLKNLLFTTTLVTLLATVVLAQDSKAPVTHLGGSGGPDFHANTSVNNPAAPRLIFYGGDITPSDPNAFAFPNGNTLMVPDTTTYSAVGAPNGISLIITGLLFNQVANIQTGTIFDPAWATYDIRRDITPGNGGVSVVHGSGPQTAIPTGRMPFGYVEYATSVMFQSPITVRNGGGYYLNLSSQCTDSNNENCANVQFFVDNTTQQTNGINTQFEPSLRLYINSEYFGYNWEPACEAEGLNDQQCSYLSFGVYGHY